MVDIREKAYRGQGEYHYFSISGQRETSIIQARVRMYQLLTGWHAEVTFVPPGREQGRDGDGPHLKPDNDPNAVTLDVVLNGNGRSKALKKIERQISARFSDRY